MVCRFQPLAAELVLNRIAMNIDTQKSWEKVTVRQVENSAADRIWRGKVVIEQAATAITRACSATG